MSLLVTPNPAVKRPSPGGNLLDRAKYALYSTGWISLGRLSGSTFAESDVIYNTDDSQYYVFTTIYSGGVATGVSYRAAATLAGIVSATPVTAITGIWYPTVNKIGSNWYMWGTDGSSRTSLAIATGSPPSAFALATPTQWLRQTTPISHPVVPLIDSQARWSSAKSAWLIVGLYTTFAELPPAIFTSSQATPASGMFADAGGPAYSIFQYTGPPVWARKPDYTVAFADPNIMLVGTSYYLGFAANDGTTWRSGIVELDSTSFKAKGSPLLLNEPGMYSWQTVGGVSRVASDLCFLSCPDGIDRIFGFPNGGLASATDGTWACLELPA